MSAYVCIVMLESSLWSHKLSGCSVYNYWILQVQCKQLYTVLLNVSNSDCRVLCGSDTAQEYVDAEVEKGRGVDDMFFKYMCGEFV